MCGRAVDQAGMFTALERWAEDDNATLLFTSLSADGNQYGWRGTCKAMHVPRRKLRLSRNGSPAFAMRLLCVLAAVKATAGPGAVQDTCMTETLEPKTW